MPLLSGLPSWRLRAARKVRHCSPDAFHSDRHACEFKPHFDSGQRAHEGEIVEVAQMADAEDLAGQAAEPGAERHVESFKNDLAYAVRVVSGGKKDGGERARILARVGGEYFKAPGAYCASRRFP